MFIKNTTPYVGKVQFKIEKYPYYTSSNPFSILNKVCLNLGFTKIVSRMYPTKLESGYHKLDSEKIKLITLNTGGKIGVHEWWECKSKKSGRTQKKYSEPDLSIWDIIDHFELPESFVSENNEYIGDVQDGWWYYKNSLQVYQPLPYGVAKQVGEDGETTGYYGYTHRGGSFFRKGDRLFDYKYKPKIEDYPEWQWYGWIRKIEKLKLTDSEVIPMEEIIPFNMRGNVIIETWDQAIEAATNLKNHLN